MANKIYIELNKIIIEETGRTKGKKGKPDLVTYNKTPTKEIIVSSLLEDVTIDVQSQFGSYGEMVPGLSSIIHLVSTISSSSGSIGEGLLGLTNQLDAARWEKTDPVRLSVRLGFFTKDDSFANVVEPVQTLIGMSILTYDAQNKRYATPGMNLKNMSDFTKQKGKSTEGFLGSKFCSVVIPGIIYLPIAYIEKATPTFSRQVTERDMPLWATLELLLVGTFPALESDFTNSLDFANLSSNYKVESINDLKKIYPI